MRDLLFFFAASIILIGCATETGGPGPGPIGGTASALDACFARGGHLREVSTIDNVVLTAHGAIHAIDVSSDAQIAVGSEDGSIKLWSVDGRSGATLGAMNRVT